MAKAKSAKPAAASAQAPAQRFFEKDAWLTAAAAWMTARLVTIIGGWMGVAMVPQGAGGKYDPMSFSLIDSFLKWDSGWYLNVIANGYSWDPAQATTQQNIGFFPLYPMLAKVLSFGSNRGASVMLILIAWVASYLALVVFYQLARVDLNPGQAFVATFGLALLPGALFFFMGYTEALFVLLAALTLLLARRQAWWLAAVAGGLAALTRSLGFLLVVPLAIEWIVQRRESKEPLIDVKALSILGPAIGLGVWTAYLGIAFKDPLAWSHSQVAWRQSPAFFLVTLYREAVYMLKMPAINYLPKIEEKGPMTLLFDWTALVAVLGISLAGVRRLRLSYLAWILIALAVPLQTGQSWNMVRYVMAAFPAMIAFGAVVKDRRLSTLWLGVSAALLVLATALSLSGRWLA